MKATWNTTGNSRLYLRTAICRLRNRGSKVGSFGTERLCELRLLPLLAFPWACFNVLQYSEPLAY